MIGSSIGKYRVAKRLGEGGMGQVVLALDIEAKRLVAIKLLHSPLPSLEARFKREFRLLKKLSHPNIVGVDEFGVFEGKSYLVMEFVQGNTLDGWVGAMPSDVAGLRRLVDSAIKIAQGLDYIHHQGMIHRDLKPENILVNMAGEPKITDFGLARNIEASINLTQQKSFLGTVLYAPPEQIQGRPLDHRADLYAFGAMLYRLFTGDPPFMGDMTAVVMGHMRQPPPPPRSINPAITPAIEELLLSLLAKNPADRPDSAQAVADTLKSLDPETLDRPRRSMLPPSANQGSQSQVGQTIAPGTNTMAGSIILEPFRDVGKLLAPPFLGRDGDKTRLAAVTVPALVLAGEAGMGKTRLMEEFLRDQTGDNNGGWRVLLATPSPNLTLPLEPLATWIRAAIKRAMRKAQELTQQVPLPASPNANTNTTADNSSDTVNETSDNSNDSSVAQASDGANTVDDSASPDRQAAWSGSIFDANELTKPASGPSLRQLLEEVAAEANTASDPSASAFAQSLAVSLTSELADSSANTPTIMPITGSVITPTELNNSFLPETPAVYPPELAALLAQEGPILANIVPELGDAVALPGEQAQYTLFASTLRFLRAIMQRPLYLVIDSAERTDDATFAFIAYTLRSGESNSVRFALTLRDDEIPDKNRRALQVLGQEGLLETVALPALLAEDSGRLIQATLGGPTDQALLDHIFERSGGNPWMAGEVLRGLVEAGQLYRNRRYWEWNRMAGSLSASVHELMEGRFLKLPDSAQELASVAAVIGETLRLDELVRLSGRNEDELLDDLERLIRAKLLLEERVGREERYRFAQPLLRDAALERLSPAHRRRLHLNYAETLEEHPNPNPEALTGHWAQAGNGDKAAYYALLAAERAEAVYALPSSEPFLRIALEELEQNHMLRSEIELYIGRIATFVGRSDEAEAILLRLLAETSDASQQPRIRLALAELYQKQSRWSEAVQLLEQDLDNDMPPRGWQSLISSLRLSGKLDEALEMLDRAAPLFEESPSLKVYLLYQKANILFLKKNFEQSRELIKMALSMLDSLDDPVTAARAYTTIGKIEFLFKNYDAALSYFDKSVFFTRQIGDLRGICASLINISSIFYTRNEINNAIGKVKASLEIADRAGYQDLKAHNLNNLSEFYYLNGDMDLAESTALEGISISKGIGIFQLIGDFENLISRVKTKRENDEEAN
jgi:serine/threonine protein kinase/tetratricopeptide (TPR) repeat protein